MVAFITSFLALVVLCGLVFLYGSRRPVGTPTTWGEAIVGGTVVFFIFFLAYGIVPDTFLKWADGKSLNWRSDSIGIPAGPLNLLLSGEGHYYSEKANVFFPQGVTFFGRGRVLVTKQAIRDILAANIYIVFLGINIYMWGAWQKRGKKAADKAALEPTSSYGRPIMKKA